jgi:FMN-dependent NADH-azoreductase
MKQVLIIESSPRGAESASRQLTEKLKERLRSLYPEATFVEHDLAKDPLPHLDYPTVKAIFTRDQVEAESLNEVLRLSDQHTDEVLSSDLLVIASPMWNFGLPSIAKSLGGSHRSAREDFPLLRRRSGRARSPKKSDSRAGLRWVFTDGPWKPWDTVEPYLRLILGFIGITDVQTVRAEGMNIPPLAPHAISAGERAIEMLAI